MLNQKVNDVVRFLDALTLEKLEYAVTLAGTKRSAEAIRYIIFSEMQVKGDEANRLLNEDYEPLLVRIEGLCANRHYKEAAMLGLLFLKDYNNDTTLYGEDIIITQRPVTKILYFLCEALLQQQQYNMCYEYIKLLAKIAVIYPDYFDEFLNERISEMFDELKDKLN